MREASPKGPRVRVPGVQTSRTGKCTEQKREETEGVEGGRGMGSGCYGVTGFLFEGDEKIPKLGDGDGCTML